MSTRPTPPQKPAPAAMLLNQAVAHHQAGRLDEAAALYRQIMLGAPGHFDATHLTGVIALQRGDLATAEALIGQALAIRAKDAAALNNLGTTLLRAKRLDEAREQFERAVKAQPAMVDALSNLGSVLRQLGRVADSVAPLRRAFAGNPKSAAVADLLGASLIDTGDGRGASAVFEASVKTRPADANAWTHLAIASLMAGNTARALEAAAAALRVAPDSTQALGLRGQALAATGDVDGARAAFEAAVRAASGDAGAQINYGVFLRSQGEFEGAIARLRRALELDPESAHARQELVDTLVETGRSDEAMREGRAFADGHPDGAAALVMLGTVHFAQGRIDDALEAYRRAVAAPGAGPSAFVGHGDALMASGEAVAALKQYTRALELDPQSGRARFSAAMAHLHSIYDDAAQMEASRRGLIRALSELDAWFTPARATAGAQAVGSAQPFYLAYHSVNARPLLAPYGKTIARLMAQGVVAPRPSPANSLGPLRSRRLRVGIAAAHVRDHSVWNAITQGWVRHFDPSRIELFLFQLERASDTETARARQDAAHFVDAPATLSGWSQAIVEAQLDVLIYPEIGMHPLTTRLAAMRLAPVQATSWGQPLTSGLPTMDLYLSAAAFEPSDAASHYVEKLVALPRLGVCVQPLAPIAVEPDLAQLGLPASEPLLLCPGSPFKYTPQGDATWAALGARLQARGGGRLVFFRSHRPTMSAHIERRMRLAFAAAGVDYDRTVAWIPSLDRARYFGLMQRATALLDTIGFSGFNTALQALECGVPVVAFEGEFMRGRLASGPLRLMGLDELVARDSAGFVEIALRLVEDSGWNARMRTEIAQRRPTLFNDTESVRALEDALLAEALARHGR